MQHLPSTFTIETTLACDLKCPECALGGGMISRQRGMMSFASYRAIADKIRPYARYVYLHIWGDPMLNPEILEMIRYTAPFAGTNVSTNGLSLTTDKAAALIGSGVSDVIVSIDGATQETYQKYRVGGDLEKAFSALALLAQENRRTGGKVRLMPQFIVFEHNRHEMEAFSKRCAELGLPPTFKAPYIRNDSQFAYCSDPNFQRPCFHDAAAAKEAMRACSNPREVFTVLLDGSVVACCHDYAGTTTFGNIFDQGVMEIWNSPGCLEFRAAVTGANAPEFCLKNCMTWLMDRAAAPQGAPAPEPTAARMVNLCCGPVRIPGFINIDAVPGGDLQLDLNRELLPFPDESVDAVVCISAINYFSYRRGGEIIRDVHRILKPGGIARFASQDLRVLARRYLERDEKFFFQLLPEGRERFPGPTFCDKFNEFFYGFGSGENHCRYVYDAESLSRHFSEAGFAVVEKKRFLESAIAGADRFDNRPDQMFFLEAVKGNAAPDRYHRVLQEKSARLEKALQSPGALRERAVTMMRTNRERGWQLLLRALEGDPSDRRATELCAEILHQEERYEDLVKLYSAYLEAVPDDAAMRGEAQRARKLAQARREALEAAALRCRVGLDLEMGFNSVLPDREHLDAAACWLRQAQRVNPAGGVSALYYLDTKRWDVDYPETTGYIIPTLLAHYRLTGDPSFRDDAARMGEWEIDIQTAEGGAGEPYGVYGLRPRVFNTGQVLLGFVSLYRETGAGRYLDAATRAGDWIVSCLDSEGRWCAGTYRGPKSYKSRVAWALLELFDVCGTRRYRDAAEQAIRWILGQAQENGWFAENSLTHPERPWTHLTGYALVGLLEVCRLNGAGLDRDRVLRVLSNAAWGNARCYLERRRSCDGPFTIFPGTLDKSWHSRDNWSCVTGTAQTAYFLRRMGVWLEESTLVEASEGMVDDLKMLQMIDGVQESELFGGLPGAYPFGAPYCSYAIPNWGVKFFADSLLHRVLPGEKLDCIG